VFKVEKEADVNKLVVSEEMDIIEIEKEISASDCDIAYIQNPSSEMLEYFTGKGFYYCPNKVTYKIRVPIDSAEYFKIVKKYRRKKIKKALKSARENGINFVCMHPVSEDVFKEWFEIYKKNILGKPRGFLRASLERHRATYERNYGIFALKENEIIGGILLKKKRFLYQREMMEKLSISFSSSKKEYLKLRINDALNYETIIAARKWGFDFLERGLDSNLYGHYLSPGLFLFKKSFGYRIASKQKYGYSLFKIINFSKFQDKVFFISFEDGQMIGNLFFKNEMPDVKEYRSSYFSKLRIFKVVGNNAEELQHINEKQIIRI